MTVTYKSYKNRYFSIFCSKEIYIKSKNEHEDSNNNFLLFILLNIGTLTLKNTPYIVLIGGVLL